MKDFATKKTRMEGVIEPSPAASEKSVPIGRWVLLGFGVCLIVGYAVWNHRQELLSWVKSKSPAKSEAQAVPPAKPITPTTIPGSSAPAVQFDFYHVLTHPSDNKAASEEELVKTNKISVNPPPPSPPAVSSAIQPVPATESVAMKPIEEEAVPATKPAAPVVKAAPPESPKPAPIVPLVAKPPVKALSPLKADGIKTSTPKPVKAESYEVEVATFTDKNKAQALRAKLLMEGFEPQISAQNGHYRVHFGLMKNSNEAQALRHQLAKSGVSSSILLVPGESRGN